MPQRYAFAIPLSSAISTPADRTNSLATACAFRTSAGTSSTATAVAVALASLATVAAWASAVVVVSGRLPDDKDG